ncbi:Response regulator [Sulfidibacter corallicola]|uniref:Response regulator n=1 Tax=Sulfidibacter corallicola TaxID=2818388 RepID=A0A8A4TTV7_SULCO|nr:response regulator [Sulfidibacter corallicola]QTD52472.1 response regulator [Sulfidibacter corallicola]
MLQSCQGAFDSKRILIVDDEPMVRKLLLNIVKRTHHAGFEAENGSVALALYEQEPFDLVVLDLRMPVQGGRDFLKEAASRGWNLNVIVLTGHGELDEAFQLLTLYRISDFIQKPLQNPFQLIFAINNALEKRKHEAELKDKNKQLQKELAFRKRAEENLAKEKDRVAFLLKESQSLTMTIQMSNEELVHQRQRLVEQQKEIVKDRKELAAVKHNLACQLESVYRSKGFYANALVRLCERTEACLKAVGGPDCSDALRPEPRQEGERGFVLDDGGSAPARLLEDFQRVVLLYLAESGQVENEPERVVVRELLSGCRERLEQILAWTDADVVVRCDDSVPDALFIDPSLFGTIVENLATCGIHRYSRESVEISLDMDVPAHLGLHVKRTGYDLAPEERTRLFEPFREVEPLSRADWQGMDLGPAISARLAKMVGGDIRVTRHVPEGIVFHVSLPLANPAQPSVDIDKRRETDGCETERHAEQTSEGRFFHEKPLILFDRDLMRGFQFAKSLKQNGAEMMIADSPEVICRQLERQEEMVALLLRCEHLDEEGPHLVGELRAVLPKRIPLVGLAPNPPSRAEAISQFGLAGVIDPTQNPSDLLRKLESLVTRPVVLARG